jgi:hypothetical protein
VSGCRWNRLPQGRERENMNRFIDVFCWGREKALDYIQVTHLINF